MSAVVMLTCCGDANVGANRVDLLPTHIGPDGEPRWRNSSVMNKPLGQAGSGERKQAE